MYNFMIIAVNNFDIKKIAESGQCFRLNESTDHLFNVIYRGNYLTIKNLPWDEADEEHLNMIGSGDISETVIELSCSESEYEEIWKDYFDLHQDYDTFTDMIDSNDIFLNAAYEYGRGIRILNQDPWEMLISFIISQRKSIPAIKTSIERLSEACGDRIHPDVYAFPGPEQILALSDEKLDACGLGYRKPYIIKAAENVASGALDLEALKGYDDESLKSALMEQHGVGEKVASCIMLFGYHRLDAFPKDVWINRALSERYPQGFPFDRYRGYNGIMQQYIFFYKRNSDR